MTDLSMNFLKQGTDLNEFYCLLNDIADSTKVISIKSDRLSMLAIANSDSEALELSMMPTPLGNNEYFKEYIDKLLKNGKVPVVHMNCTRNTCEIRSLKLDSMKNKIDKGTISDLLYDSKMLINIESENFVVSPCAFLSLLPRAGLGGTTMHRPSIGRVMEITKELVYRRPQKLILITRENETKGKTLIAAHSEQYAYIKQTIIRDIIDAFSNQFGAVECLEWAVTQERTYCYITFPDVAKDIASLYNLPDEAVPGICISTSDCGESSLQVRSFWSVKNHIFGDEIYRCKHRGNVGVDEFVTKTSKQIYAEYKTVPEKLQELLKIDINQPVAALKEIFTKIGMTKVLGKKKSTELFNAMSCEFSPTLKYTAYDIVLSVSTVAERALGASQEVIQRIQDTAKKAIFVDFKDISAKLTLGA